MFDTSSRFYFGDSGHCELFKQLATYFSCFQLTDVASRTYKNIKHRVTKLGELILPE